MSKIKKKPIIDSGHIKKSPLISDDNLRFSFKYLHLGNKFNIEDCNYEYFYNFIIRLKAISCIKVNEFIHNRSDALRCHTHKWENTTEPNGFNNLPLHLQDYPGWQFSLSAAKYGRIHGILINETFYIIWFDPKHKLWNDKKANIKERQTEDIY